MPGVMKTALFLLVLMSASVAGALAQETAQVPAEGATIESAQVTGVPEESLSADLRGAQFAQTLAYEARFDLANLERAQLPRCDARKARFNHAKCRYADFSHARLDLADLGDANLEASVLHATSLDGARLGGANLKDAARTDPELARAESFRRG